MPSTFTGKERTIKWESVPRAEKLVIHFGDSTQTFLLKSETIASFADTGRACFVRLRFAPEPIQSGISKDHNFTLVMWQGGATVGYTKESLRELVQNSQVTTRIKIMATKLGKPEIRHGLQHLFRVDVFETESTLTNLRELFFFPALPAEIASSDEKIQTDWLADCVRDLLNRERQQFRAQAEAQQKEQRQNFPARNPSKDYGKQGFDHYTNQRDVLEKLLRKKWPQLSKAIDTCRETQTEQERQEQQSGLWLGYIADYKSHFKKLPDIDEKDFGELSKNEKWHDHYVQLMNGAIDAIPKEDKRDWQLAIGWIQKNYYRMNESDLETAFARDWNYKFGLNRGHTLATRAHRIGLVSYLKPGPKK